MKLFIAGDSTAAKKLPEKRPEAGWGEFIGDFFTDQVTVENLAINGRSTKSFIAEGRLLNIAQQIQPGDYLFIQFGHNDQKIEDDTRGTDPYTTYQENLLQFVEVAKKNQATPVLLTSVTRRGYVNGKIDSTLLGDYPEACRQLAKEKNIPLLDLNCVTIDFFNEYNDDTSRQFFLQLPPHTHVNYPNGVCDNTHFNELGAKTVAKLVAETLALSSLPLKKELKNISVKNH